MAFLISKDIFRNMLKPIVVQGFQDFVEGADFRFPRNNHPGILHFFDVSLYVVIELRNSFQFEWFIIIIGIYLITGRDDKINMHSVIRYMFDCIGILRETGSEPPEAKGQAYNKLFHRMYFFCKLRITTIIDIVFTTVILRSESKPLPQSHAD